jgi:hypothetical protein
MPSPPNPFYGERVRPYKLAVREIDGNWEHLSERAIDGFLSRKHHGHTMQETAFATNRRSQRVFHRMKLQALGRSHSGKKFREVCETLVVNAHGGLLTLQHEVDNDAMIVLVNPETLEELECRIVFTGEPCAKGMRVGVEFLTPAPHFWGIDFDAPRQTSREVERTH